MEEQATAERRRAELRIQNLECERGAHYLAETRDSLRERSSWRTESTRRPRQVAMPLKAKRPAGAERAARPRGRRRKKASAAVEHPLAARAAIGDGLIIDAAQGSPEREGARGVWR